LDKNKKVKKKKDPQTYWKWCIPLYLICGVAIKYYYVFK